MNEFKIQKLLTKNRFILSGVALIVTFTLFGILQLNHFLNTILQGYYYVYYQLMFLPLMLFAFQYYLKRHMASPKKPYRVIIFGIIAGYISSLLATDLELIFIPYGWERFLNSFRTFNDLLIRFFAPILYLSWLFGGLMGAIVVLLLKFSARGKNS
jgi:hypothetical protein